LSNRLRDLPSVDRVLSHEQVARLIERYSRRAVTGLVRAELDACREAIGVGGPVPALDEIAAAIERRAADRWKEWPGAVINATGVILHTNLGRAPLSRAALDAIERTAAGYNDLEMDLETGKRGSRQAHLSQLVCEVTGAAAAIAVNNNASAILLGLAAIAAGKEVIVSRSEAVEIGGGFRIPDVLRQSGATLVEVGTTNRTYVSDYADAINENTGAILTVHSSNFLVSGFVHSPELRELVQLGAERAVPVLHDLGSGCLLDTTDFGLAHEPMPQESVAAGVSLSFFSGDKLLGGPQAGIIVGDDALVSTVSSHPLARAVRIDKAGIAALSATLMHYIKEEATGKIPIWRMISRTADDIGATADRWAASIGHGADVVDGLSTIGGGSLPGEVLGSRLVRLGPPGGTGGPDALAQRLRRGKKPVVARIEDDSVLLDPRTVLPDQEADLLKTVSEALDF
jgi:L-seryl-tRNA(Ser) seleniumtransferase